MGDLSARDAKEFDAAVLAKEKKVTFGASLRMPSLTQKHIPCVTQDKEDTAAALRNKNKVHCAVIEY